ncbi:MAG: hypothetical protein GYA21_13115 [Myxococcales bacterium]|nr:hypothetical protein [Myxococcales bacterium]
MRASAAFGPAVEAAVRAQIPPDVFEQIEAAAKIEWLPVQLDVVFTEGVYQVLGESGVRKLSHDAMVRSTEGSLTGPFLRGTLRLFGLSPAHLLKLARQFWQVVYRDCGRAEAVSIGPGESRIELFDIPPVMGTSPPYLKSIQGGIEGVLTLTRVQGSVELDTTRKQENRFTFTVRWIKR